MTASKSAFEEFLRGTEERGNEEGHEAQIGDLIELAWALYEQLTPEQWEKCRYSLRMRDLADTLFA